MKKKLLVFLVCLCLALGAGGTITAFAGINTNSPTGTGIISGGGLNDTNYVIWGDDTAKAAYDYKVDNTTYKLDGVSAHNVSSFRSIPKGDVVDGSKFVMQINIHDFGSNPGANNFAFGAFCRDDVTRVDWINNNMMSVVLRAAQGGTVVAQVNSPAGTTAEYWVGDEQITTEGATKANLGFQSDKLAEQKAKGRSYVTFWFEADVTEKSLTIYSGYNDGTTDVEKTKHGTIKNAIKVESVAEAYSWCTQMPDYEIDGYKLYRTTNGTADKSYITCDFETTDSITVDPQHKSKLIILGDGAFKSYAVVEVTNPSEDVALSVNAPLGVDARLSKTFDLTASLKIQSMGAESTRKVGIAFGLYNYRQSLRNPQEGASFIYVGKGENDTVVLGACNIDENGNQTATGTETVLNNATIGESASFIDLTFVGKGDGSVDVTYGEQTVNFPNIKQNGYFAIAHTGTGDVTYLIQDGTVNATGYQLTTNAGGAVSSRFDGNFMSPTKFNVQSTTAPSGYISAVEGGHEIAGMVAEDGKIGFYGSSTNTVLTFAEEYSDFVMQVDYTSAPYKQRGKLGGIESGGDANRYSPVYIVFGGEAGISPLADYYALGIVEGNATQYFWGVESAIAAEGKTAAEGNELKPLAPLAECDEDETAIPWYAAAPEGSPTKYTISKWGKPNPTATAPSFYNKTTRFKLVVINNHVALYAAEVNTDTNELAGEYVKVYEFVAKDSTGYVGIVTDSPAWGIIDNLAITPISTEKAIELGVNAVPAVDLVADIAVTAMDEDPEPTPLATPVATVNAEAKKVTWEAVANAGGYRVTVKLGNVVKVNNFEVNEGTEYDLSALTEAGEYDVTVVAVPADAGKHLNSKATTVKYTVTASQEKPGDKPGEGGNQGGSTTAPEKKKGCGSNVNLALGGVAVLMLGGVAIALVRRKKGLNK